jgi:tRNA threonylcarbamoyl adenosine modification protein YeaZ
MKLLNNEKLGAIALSLGPGMFTSLRVGLGLVKGLYLSHNVPVYGINTLEVIAKSFFPFNAIKSIHNRIVCVAVIEAFQNEFFVALYGPRGRIGNDLLVTARGLMDHLNCKLKNAETIIVVGPGARSLKQNEIFRKNWTNEKGLLILDSDLYFASASKVVNVALSRIRAGKCDNPDLLEPYYIKKTAAETKGSRK